MQEERLCTFIGSKRHEEALIAALQPLMAVANAGSFYFEQRSNTIRLRQTSFTGVDLVAVQAAIDAAVIESKETEVEDFLLHGDKELRAITRTFLELINAERTARGASTISFAQFVQRAKTNT